MAQADDFPEFNPYGGSSGSPFGQLDDLFKAVNPSHVSDAASRGGWGTPTPTQGQSSSAAPPIYPGPAGTPYTNFSGQHSVVPSQPSGPNGPISSIDQPMWDDLWAKSGKNPQTYTQNVIGQLGLRGRQTDPTAINTILRALQAVGVNGSLDQRTDQYHKGMMLNGQFIKLLDGNDNWTWLPGGNGPSNESPTNGVADQMFDDPATKMFQSMVLKRIDDLMQAVKRPDDDAYRKAALSRVDQLHEAPYSAGEEQALITRMREPLTQARDARMAFNKEQMGGRNILPSSGLFQDQVYNTPERDYERALAGGTNDLAVRAIDEKSNRNNQALDILSNLVGLDQGHRNEDQGRARESLTTGAILPDLTERRLQLLMQSLGLSESAMPSLLSTMTNLNAQNQNASQFAAGQRNDNAAAIGNLLGFLINSPLLNPKTWRA